MDKLKNFWILSQIPIIYSYFSNILLNFSIVYYKDEMTSFEDIEVNGGTNKVKCLSIPWFKQEGGEAFCVPCSIKICLEYFKNYYGNSLISAGIDSMDIAAIGKLLNTRKDSGTPVNNEMIKKLNERFMTLNFTMALDSTFNHIKKHIYEKKLPAIILYDYDLYLNGERGDGHAGVVKGLDDSYIILSNPWGGTDTIFELTGFEEVWRVEARRLITIEPKRQILLNGVDVAR